MPAIIPGYEFILHPPVVVQPGDTFNLIITGPFGKGVVCGGCNGPENSFVTMFTSATNSNPADFQVHGKNHSTIAVSIQPWAYFANV